MIRVAGADDWRAWRDLRLRALADAPDAFGELYAEAAARDEPASRKLTLPRPDRVCLFADRDGVAVGMAVVAISEEPSRVNLYAMWVAPEARRAGAGRALVAAALRWARAKATLALALRVSTSAVAARRMYAAAGFVDSGERSPLRPGAAIVTHTLIASLHPLVMGVVNVTPDSFSDGTEDREAAVAHGLGLGADIIDVGGEATNPRARPVTATEELRRVLPVIERLVAAGATVSIDTTKAEVARAAIAAGARIVNDISGGLFDPEMGLALAGTGITYVAGHLRGRSLPEVFAAEGGITWEQVAAELAERLAALPADVAARAWVDPGIGFGKGADARTNHELLRHAGDIGRALGRPVVVGPSRKRFLRAGLVNPTELDLDRATVAACLEAGDAHVLRVHNVALLRAALSQLGANREPDR